MCVGGLLGLAPTNSGWGHHVGTWCWGKAAGWRELELRPAGADHKQHNGPASEVGRPWKLLEALSVPCSAPRLHTELFHIIKPSYLIPGYHTCSQQQAELQSNCSAKAGVATAASRPWDAGMCLVAVCLLTVLIAMGGLTAA